MLIRVPHIKIRIALVEQNALLRDGLKALLTAEPDFVVVGDFDPGLDAVELIGLLQPDIVLTELDAPHTTPIAYLKSLRRRAPCAHVVVLTSRRPESTIKRAFLAGVHGYVHKDSGSHELMAALRATVAGERSPCKPLPLSFVRPVRRTAKASDDALPAQILTGRERQILTQVALGESNKDIARSLTLSIKTVEKHRGNLMRKLKLRNAAAVTLYAVRNGMTQLNAISEMPDPQTRA